MGQRNDMTVQYCSTAAPVLGTQTNNIMCVHFRQMPPNAKVNKYT